MADSFYKATLASFGTPAPDSVKYVDKWSLALEGDTGGGTWVSIPRDEYEVDQENGILIQRSVDDDGNAVDWSGYSAFRATYNLHDITATSVVTTYLNEAQTFAEDDTGFSPIGPEGQVCLAFGKNIYGAFIRAARGLSLGVKYIDPSTYADTANIELDHENYPTVYASGAVAGGYTIIGIKRGDDGALLTYINSMSDNVTFKRNVAGLSAGYAKIATHTGADVTTTGNGSVILQYIAQDNEWYVLNAWG